MFHASNKGRFTLQWPGIDFSKEVSKDKVRGACCVCLAGPLALNLKILPFVQIIARLICDWTADTEQKSSTD